LKEVPGSQKALGKSIPRHNISKLKGEGSGHVKEGGRSVGKKRINGGGTTKTGQ